jgi:dTDP-4-dehydrorhamnose 3,5-epimerase
VLDDVEHRALYLPPGVAHGFLTLVPDSEVFYQMSVPHQQGAGSGFRWDDPDVGIDWPARPSVISERDRGLPVLADASFGPVSAPTED